MMLVLSIIALLLALGNVKPLMVPSTTASNIVNWDCRLGATADENVKYLPSSCRDNG